MLMDINCDLGEGIGRDADIMPYLDSCSIACGGHAGDRKTMISTIRLAKEHGVKIGAHPSFEDRKNFGRSELYVPRERLRSQLIHQIAEISVLSKLEDVELNHVKPHGALYNMAARSADLAGLVVEVVTFFKEDIILYVPFGSQLERKAREAGIPFAVEAFADRNYNDQFQLLSREQPEALIVDPQHVKDRIARMMQDGEVRSVSGKVKKVSVDTICIHGDNPMAVEIARELYNLKSELN
jgi:UPF0271 protein